MGRAPIDHFFCYYVGATQISFFVYTLCMHGGPFMQISLLNSYILYGGTLRLVSSHTIRARARIRPSDRFVCILHGGPRSSCNKFICLLYGPGRAPLRTVYLLTLGGGGSRSVSSHIICPGPSLRSLRSVSSFTLWGPPGQFLRILYGAPVPLINYFIYFYFLSFKLSLWGGGGYFLNFQGGCPLLPPVAGAHECRYNIIHFTEKKNIFKTF